MVEEKSEYFQHQYHSQKLWTDGKHLLGKLRSGCGFKSNNSTKLRRKSSKGDSLYRTEREDRMEENEGLHAERGSLLLPSNSQTVHEYSCTAQADPCWCEEERLRKHDDGAIPKHNKATIIESPFIHH